MVGWLISIHKKKMQRWPQSQVIEPANKKRSFGGKKGKYKTYIIQFSRGEWDGANLTNHLEWQNKAFMQSNFQED